MYAALAGHAHLVPLLLQHGAHVDGVDVNSTTALQYAALVGYTTTLLRNCCTMVLMRASQARMASLRCAHPS